MAQWYPLILCICLIPVCSSYADTEPLEPTGAHSSLRSTGRVDHGDDSSSSPVANPRLRPGPKGAVLTRRIVEERSEDGTLKQSAELTLVFSDGQGRTRSESAREIVLQTPSATVNLSRSPAPGRVAEDMHKRGFSPQCSMPESTDVEVTQEQIPGEREVLGVMCTGVRYVYTILSPSGEAVLEEVYEEWRDLESQRVVQTTQRRSDGSRNVTVTVHPLSMPIEAALFELPGSDASPGD